MDKRDSEEKLIARLKAGDREAFGQFFEIWKDPLYRYLVTLTGNETVAEDILQDVFLKVVRKISTYTYEGKTKWWLFRIASNAALDYFRRLKREKSIKLYDEESEPVTIDRLVLSASSKDSLKQAELFEAVRHAMNELPVEQRNVLLLKHISGLRFKEIAEVCGISISTALGRMRYALIRLRKLLKEER